MADARALQARLALQRHAFACDPYPTAQVRRDRLARLATLTRHHRDEIIQAIDRDFGHRAEAETRLAEIAPLLQAVHHARRYLKRWMRPGRARVPWRLKPASGRLHYQPLGVVGIIAPANTPWQLALLPAVAALAAGNRVMIKPSEHTPATSELMTRLIARYFAPEELCVTPGDAELGAAFATLPFDHLLFSGSARAGREVARAAAANLTPITLALGGKSPAIVADDADLSHAARRIAFGKWFNAGQSCLAPDHVLIDAYRVPAFIEALREAVNAFYPDGTASKDYTAILGASQRARLQAMLEQARDHGCRVVPLGEVQTQQDAKLPPTLIIDPSEGLDVMQEEIFGPWLPIIGMRDFEAALAHVNDGAHVNDRANVDTGARSLALYAFTRDPARRQQILTHTQSGGVVFDDTLWPGAAPALPFGGVGESGTGSYRGEAGFQRFSHQRSVLSSSPHSATKRLVPPWRRWRLRLFGF
ncbi:aldehyde dehydrogenase family protein [Halomonas sp. TRM85114]|uniref:aldehyde dehydrogenase family protein n=1 Tax=Halomonas jincaotanensis TaxID=2810616 RepID=UPI001BD35CA5|nr:aldehyde dehydrogenase family protein [Halomonas jincaotanensis]MBS9402873.1 aldehyde dehydrogenase family protein [Halomonas jincaotanensis]